MFRLSDEEYTEILRSQIVTSTWGSGYLLYTFSEQAIYMLMTV